MYDIIIVGAGTAGLTAAIYGVRAGKSVLVLEAKTYGGQIINTPKIENYPGIKEISGFEYAKNLYEQAKDLGAEIRFEQVTAIEMAESGKLVKTTKDSYECRSVILATGAKNRPLSLPREQELIGAGVLLRYLRRHVFPGKRCGSGWRRQHRIGRCCISR